jgi:hypothetical protein
MAVLTVAEATTRVYEAIGRVDGDEACPAAAVAKRIDTEYRRLHRRCSFEFPSLYESVSGPTVITADVLTKPTDFEALHVLQKQDGGGWTALGALPSLNREDSMELGFFEMGDTFKITPVANAPGTYRMYYATGPGATYTTMDLPIGLEDIVIELVAVWACRRHSEEAQYHAEEAKRIWDEQYMALWNRYGAHSRSGLNVARP